MVAGAQRDISGGRADWPVLSADQRDGQVELRRTIAPICKSKRLSLLRHSEEILLHLDGTVVVHERRSNCRIERHSLVQTAPGAVATAVSSELSVRREGEARLHLSLMKAAPSPD